MELQLPKNLTEITNIFYHHRDKVKPWINSGENLVIKDGDNLVAVISPYDVVMTNDFVRRQNEKYDSLWLPTWALYKSGALKLYDKRFQKTQKGTIPLADPVTHVEETIDTGPDYKKLMGDIGEKAVANFNRGVLSENKFDNEKDGLINNHITFEVKTLRLIHIAGAFWIEESQWNKLDNVDLLYFVKVPEKDNELATAYLYYNTSLYNITKKDGKILREYPLTNCLFQFRLGVEDSALLLQYSKAISKHERFA